MTDWLWLVVEQVDDPPMATICERLGVIEGDLDPHHGSNGLVRLDAEARAYSVRVRAEATPTLTGEGVSGPFPDSEFSR